MTAVKSVSQIDVLRMTRIIKGVGVDELANKLNITTEYINELESKHRVLNPDMIKLYCDALNIQKEFIDFFDENYEYNYNIKLLIYSILSKIEKLSERIKKLSSTKGYLQVNMDS